MSEVIRSGIQAVDPGQREAALSLGFSESRAMWFVVVPQAVKNILPALGNEFIMIVKDTSLGSTFFIGDLMTQYLVVKGPTYLPIEPLVIVGIIYFLMTFILSKVFGHFERKLKRADRHSGNERRHKQQREVQSLMAQALIQVHDLKKYYNGGDVKALDGVTADIRKGDVMAVIGPSGGGKSTFLRSLNLLEKPTSGSIIFDGVDITGKKVDLPLHRQKMGMVFQHFNLFPNKTVLDNLTMAPVKIKKQSRAEAEEKAMAAPEARGPGRPCPRLARPAVRRTEAARGHRPGAGHGAGGHAVRRAHLRPRPRDGGRGAGGHEGAGAVRHDHGGGDPRDGLRPGGGQPRAVHGRRQDRRAGRPRRYFRSPPESAPSGLPEEGAVKKEQTMNDAKKAALAAIDEKKELVAAVADAIWDYAELSMQEVKSAALFVKVLKD